MEKEIVYSLTFATCMDADKVEALLDQCRRELSWCGEDVLLEEMERLAGEMRMRAEWDVAWMKHMLRCLVQWQTVLQRLQATLPPIVNSDGFLHVQCVCALFSTAQLPQMLEYVDEHASEIVDACEHVCSIND